MYWEDNLQETQMLADESTENVFIETTDAQFSETEKLVLDMVI